MVSLEGEDLGSGVYVSPAQNGELVVTSPRLDLGWRVAEGRVPGTAVVWRDQPFEATARTAAGAGDRWTLRPWPDAGAMRHVVSLDTAYVASTAERSASDRRGNRNRTGTILLLPFLGLAPARVQERWQSEWLFPAERATWVSSVLELLGGAFGLVQALALAFGSEWFLPGPLRFMAVVGPLMIAEGIVRLVLVATREEPIGSLVGLPLALFEKPAKKTLPPTEPEVRLFDEEEGVLELVSPINRVDWGHEGLLPYRDRWFALDRADREGRNWTYRFVLREKDAREHPVLHLRSPAARKFVAPRDAAPAPSILRTTLVTAAITLGPRADQERWAKTLGTNPRWLTIAGAVAELIGGLSNLGEHAAAGSVFFIVLDVFLVLEGSWRLLSALGGRPCGSVFGWLLRPLYRSSL